MSADSMGESRHLAGNASAEKQCSQGDTRVWFLFVLARGAVGAHVFSDLNFPGETQEGAAMCVAQLPRVLRRMLGAAATKPRMLFSDRGPGFYNRRHGMVTGEYAAACKQFGFKLWAGNNALHGPHAQPPDIADVLLHETATAWLRSRLVDSGASLTQPWLETPKEFASRMQRDIRDINKEYDVEGLCHEFPQRLQDLSMKTCGDRLKK